MKIRFLFILLFACIISLKTSAQNPPSDFKIVAYYSLNSAMSSDPAEFPFDKLTHVNLFFVRPDASGTIQPDLADLAPFMEAAHQHDVKVLFSIAGDFHALIKEDKRPKLIKELVTLVLDTDADGIDSDLEWGYTLGPLGMQTSLSFPSVDPSYSKPDLNFNPFIMELSVAMKEHDKLLTAALPSRLAEEVTHETLSQFDFINVMSYDNRDLRRPDRPGNHSSYIDAMDDLDYYQNTLNIAKEKLILGVPFYGRGFGPKLTDPIIGYMDYNKIVSEYPGAELVDQWTLPNGYIMYYNGIQTIKNKTELAKKHAAGIMIWELQYDATGEKSLLNAIVEAAQ